MRLATTMCAKGGDLVGDDEDEGGEEGQRRYSSSHSLVSYEVRPRPDDNRCTWK